MIAETETDVKNIQYVQGNFFEATGMAVSSQHERPPGGFGGAARWLGMMWFEEDPKQSFSSAVRRAIAHYQQKYQHASTVCIIHPQSIPTPADLAACGISIRVYASVRPRHFWLGLDEPDAPGQSIGG